MVYAWHTAHQALSEVLYIEQETNKLVSRLSRSQLRQYHDIVIALEETHEFRQLVIEEVGEKTDLLNLIWEVKILLTELKRELLIAEKNSKKVIELSRKDIDSIAPMLEGFELKFSSFKKIEKRLHIENKLAEHKIDMPIIKGKDLENTLLVYIKRIYEQLRGLECKHEDWIENKFKTFVKAMSSIHKYEVWHIEYIQSLLGMSAMELKALKSFKSDENQS